MTHRAMDSEIMIRHIATLAISLSVKHLLMRGQSPMLYFDLMCCQHLIHTIGTMFRNSHGDFLC